MKKFFCTFLAFFLLFLLSEDKILAITDPLKPSNNKFGIHIMNEKDLEDASKLVNSNGGDFGYVTLVITEAERDHDRWQKVFNQMRRLHLIPIVRLATKATGDTWDAPAEAEINNWIAFLNNLNWVTQNRYVIIANEPNHAGEWGGRVDPEGYADYLKKFSIKLRQASADFFILPAGLDPSSKDTKTSMNENKFIQKMIQSTPDVFSYIDGWTSHAYPHTSLSIYNQELNLIGKNLPVFITETGWPINKYSEAQISQNLVNAYKNIWNDPKVVAITPFILDYTAKPFDIYSWKKSDGSYYSFYNDVASLPKIKGEPVQIESGQIYLALSQPVMFTGIDFVGAILAKNTGQTIWSQQNISIGSESTDFTLKTFSANNLEPENIGLIYFRGASSQNQGIYTNSLFVTGSKNQKITNSFSIEGAFVNIDKNWLEKLVNSITFP